MQAHIHAHSPTNKHACTHYMHTCIQEITLGKCTFLHLHHHTLRQACHRAANSTTSLLFSYFRLVGLYMCIHAYAYVYTYMHICITNHPRTCTPRTYARYTQTCMHTYNTCQNSYVDTCIRTRVHIPVYTCMHRCMYSPTYMHTHITYMHACMLTFMSKNNLPQR